MVFIADEFPEEPGLQTVAVENWEQSLPAFTIPSLAARVDRRRAEFQMGRVCAGLALSRLEPSTHFRPVGVRSDRSPDWPSGFVGTITHCRGYVAALVAKERYFRGVGRDTEPLIPDDTASELGPSIALPGEVSLVTAALGIDERRALTLLFSAKESLYKCLAPRTGTFFDFADARMEELDGNARTFRLRLLRGLGTEVPNLSDFTGHFSFAGGYAHTRCLWKR